jgi:ribosomal protein S18 acetylase RimI-like enzyme
LYGNVNYFIKKNIKIIEYRHVHHEVFRAINLEWLNNYNLTEPEDLKVLDDPRGMVLSRGGYIWLAGSGDEIIGSSALLKAEDNEGVYELAKMAVIPSYQGLGVGKLLLEACLSKTAEIPCRKLVLYSNHRLAAALKMYEDYGFS